MAKQKSFTDTANVTHPQSYWKIVAQRQDFLNGGNWIVELWGWHDQQSRIDGFVKVAETMVTIPNFLLEENDDIREMLYAKLADNDPSFIGATNV